MFLFKIVILSCCPHCRLREKDKGASYALSLSYQNSTKHYKIDKIKTASGEKFAIEEGPRFDNLMDVSGGVCFMLYAEP